MTDNPETGELRASYQTLNEPTRLLGLSPGGWAAVLVAGGLGYAFLATSPLPWRLNFSLIVVGLGAPVLLLILREPGTIGPGRLVAAVFAWRMRAARVVPPDHEHEIARGAVRLDEAHEIVDEPLVHEALPWTAVR